MLVQGPTDHSPAERIQQHGQESEQWRGQLREHLGKDRTPCVAPDEFVEPHIGSHALISVAPGVGLDSLLGKPGELR